MNNIKHAQWALDRVNRKMVFLKRYHADYPQDEYARLIRRYNRERQHWRKLKLFYEDFEKRKVLI